MFLATEKNVAGKLSFTPPFTKCVYTKLYAMRCCCFKTMGYMKRVFRLNKYYIYLK